MVFFSHNSCQILCERKKKSIEIITDTLSRTMQDFDHDPEGNVTFESWFNRYEDLFARDAIKLPEETKVRLLLRKLSVRCHDKYVNYVLPNHPRDFSFADTVATLKKVFGLHSSLFNGRYKCLKNQKLLSEDFVSYAARINRMCEALN